MSENLSYIHSNIKRHERQATTKAKKVLRERKGDVENSMFIFNADAKMRQVGSEWHFAFTSYSKSVWLSE